MIMNWTNLVRKIIWYSSLWILTDLIFQICSVREVQKFEINKSQQLKNIISIQYPSIMPKYNKKFSHNYSTLSNSMRELTQATKLESSIKLYESLSLSQKLPYKTFTSSTTCKVILKPLELQYELKINPAKSYSLKWDEGGCLINFF